MLFGFEIWKTSKGIMGEGISKEKDNQKKYHYQDKNFLFERFGYGYENKPVFNILKLY